MCTKTDKGGNCLEWWLELTAAGVAMNRSEGDSVAVAEREAGVGRMTQARQRIHQAPAG